MIWVRKAASGWSFRSIRKGIRPPRVVRALRDRVSAQDSSDGLRLLLIAFATAFMFHGGLLPFTHGNTYDAFIHMFFADHYNRSWFDPWEPRWYTGFATTSYPPGTHMAIGALMYVMPLRAAFVVVQIFALMVLILGVYRFAALWVNQRAAGYSAIAAALASSISETIHLFGQLPTIFSLGIFLNGLPHVYRWIVNGHWRDFFSALIIAAATTAGHHVTTIFGSVLFIIPLALQALRAVTVLHPLPARAPYWRKITRLGWPFARGMLLAVLMIAAIAITVFPYWYWSVTDPITQVPIPHGTRESFIERPDLGFIFFLLPWGVSLLLLPYAAYLTVTTRLWPLGASLFMCVLLGTGGTTTLPKKILGGAFDILTLDRFTFWGSILILPFIGHLLVGLLHGRAGEALRVALGRVLHRFLIGGLFAAMVVMAVFPAILPKIQPLQPNFIDPVPIVNFLESDEHYRWRYLTLGFGDQFAYLSAQTTAQSVDGNYHSARRLPEMMRFSVERLENAKYLGVPGLGSLQQFLFNAEAYNLKYVFSNDAFYDPILYFSGWNMLNRLENGVMVWEKPDIPTLPLRQPRREIPKAHMLMWGILPPLALVMAYFVILAQAFGRNFTSNLAEARPVAVSQTAFRRPRLVRNVVLTLAGLLFLTILGVSGYVLANRARPLGPQETLEAYYDNLDFRRHGAAYALLDPATRASYDEVLFGWRWRGGLLASYGKLMEIELEQTQATADLVDWNVTLHWQTALDTQIERLTLRTVRRSGLWYVVPVGLRPVQTPVRFQRSETVSWNTVGRRQPRAKSDTHRDALDRPEIALDGVRLVKHDGLYHLLGQATNITDAPASLTFFGEMYHDDTRLARQASGVVAGQRLLPAEVDGFRIMFEGVLSLKDSLASGAYDPALFIPPELTETPTEARLEARALVGEAGYYRGVALNGVRAEVVDDYLRLWGLAANTGTETVSIARITSSLFDADGGLAWVDAGFVDTNLYPGQSAEFELRLPLRASIEVVDEVASKDIQMNGITLHPDLASVPQRGTVIDLNGLGGYDALRLQVSSFTFDPVQ